MKMIFFGTPNYVVPIVDKLHKTLSTKKNESPIVAVVTQPPRRVGRKQTLEYSPVDAWAHRKEIKILRDLDIKKIPEADVGILASYGEIIPKLVISHFKFGILNIHPSLLPKWRGASPVQATLVSGETQTGVSIIKIDEELDHGPIISQFKEEVAPGDTTATLRARLFERSADVLVTLLPAYTMGKITPREQDHSKSTFTREIKNQDAFIPPKYLPAALQGLALRDRESWKIPFLKANNKPYNLQPTTHNLYNFIRSMQPWPQAWTYVKLKVKSEKLKVARLKLLKAHLDYSQLVLDEVQLEGKNPVSWKQFIEGYPEAVFT